MFILKYIIDFCVLVYIFGLMDVEYIYLYFEMMYCYFWLKVNKGLLLNKIYFNDKSVVLWYYWINKVDCLINYIYFNGFLFLSLFYFFYNFNLFLILFIKSGINDVNFKCSFIVFKILFGCKILIYI